MNVRPLYTVRGFHFVSAAANHRPGHICPSHLGTDIRADERTDKVSYAVAFRAARSFVRCGVRRSAADLQLGTTGSRDNASEDRSGDRGDNVEKRHQPVYVQLDFN